MAHSAHFCALILGKKAPCAANSTSKRLDRQVEYDVNVPRTDRYHLVSASILLLR